jgi:pyruvate/2-oxoglutarate dehydrogenase complex dihydrolipoamide dehydrogenase (E3) component
VSSRRCKRGNACERIVPYLELCTSGYFLAIAGRNAACGRSSVRLPDAFDVSYAERGTADFAQLPNTRNVWTKRASVTEVDVLVIGAGPAGTAAAIRAAELGATAALVTRDAFGGMSANEGPIPVRTLAHAARLAREARQLPRYGIPAPDPNLNYAQLVARTGEVVHEAREHSNLLDKVRETGVSLYEHAGTASFSDPHTIRSERGPTFRAGRIVICAGGLSRPLRVPGAELSVTPADAFGLVRVPQSLVVIGSGATGAQVASIFNAFGSSITLLESGPRIIRTEDADVSRAVARAFREDGIDVREQYGSVERLEPAPKGIRVVLGADVARETLEAEYAVCAIGWIADTVGLNLAAAGVRVDSRGFIEVDSYLRTSVPHVYAAGDIIGRSMLVPQAVQQGIVAGGNASGAVALSIPDTIDPIGSFTDPEYAHVGLAEDDARESHSIAVSMATYAETTRPIIDGRTRGFCKLIVDREKLTILGCHIVGERAVEVAQMAAIAMSADMRIDDLASVPLSFPTYANVLGRAALRASRSLDLSFSSSPMI